jgi:hypothetical protein
MALAGGLVVETSDAPYVLRGRRVCVKHGRFMIDSDRFVGVQLPGGFVIGDLSLTSTPMVDALNRLALARTQIIGNRFTIALRADMSELEQSISLYHEVLEAATVASRRPPNTVREFGEDDFEHAAQQAHQEMGEATPNTLCRLLQSYGFEPV